MKNPKNTTLQISAVILFGVTSFVVIYIYYPLYIEDLQTEKYISLFAKIITGHIAIISLILLLKRVKNQEKQIGIQINQRVDERFNSGISLLGSAETSARTGAIYALKQLAVENKKYRNQIAQIFCSHICSKTNEADYQTHHKERPSNEIQTCINLLFKENGLYEEFDQDLDKANLSYAHLVGANFKEAKCQRVNFEYAQLQTAIFSYTQCQGANFSNAQCQGVAIISAQCQGAQFLDAQFQKANFSHTECRGATFRNAACQGVIFSYAECQGVDFSGAQCQGANFNYTQCQETRFLNTQCQGMLFWNAQCQKADFSIAECQGADFRGAQCQGANFSYAQCQGANFLNTQCQDIYATDDAKNITSKDVELRTYTLILKGAIDEEAIQAIENAKAYLSDDWYRKMQQIITENKDTKIEYSVPKGCITGTLSSEESQAIIDKDWDKLQQLQSTN